MTVDTVEENLGDVARAAAGDGDEGPAQPALVDEGIIVRFVGVRFNNLGEAYGLGDQVAFVVKGEVVADGHELMADEHKRHIQKVRVDSIAPA